MKAYTAATGNAAYIEPVTHNGKKKFRVVYDQLELPSDFIGECECPMCGDDDRRADYGDTCRFCGHGVYAPCLEVDLAWCTPWGATVCAALDKMEEGEPMSAFYPELIAAGVTDVIRTQ